MKAKARSSKVAEVELDRGKGDHVVAALLDAIKNKYGIPLGVEWEKDRGRQRRGRLFLAAAGGVVGQVLTDFVPRAKLGVIVLGIALAYEVERG